MIKRPMGYFDGIRFSSEKVFVGPSSDFDGLTPEEGGWDLSWLYDCDTDTMYRVWVVDGETFSFISGGEPNGSEILTKDQRDMPHIHPMYYFLPA